MPTADSQSSDFAALPAELRIKIYQFALLSDYREHYIWRNNLPNLRTMRFRYNQPSRMFRERCPLTNGVACKDPRCRSQSGIDGYIVEPVELKVYAFGLFYTSRLVSQEARAVFYGQTHFVFDNRFDLHIFLMNLQETAEFIKSVTFSWPKSNGPHTEEIKLAFTRWSLRFELCYGPELSTSIRELAEACPKLEFLEMIDTMPNIPTKDAKEFDSQPYEEWTLVKQICKLGLKGFTYPSWPISESIDEGLRSYLAQKATRREEIECHVNNVNTTTS